MRRHRHYGTETIYLERHRSFMFAGLVEGVTEKKPAEDIGDSTCEG